MMTQKELHDEFWLLTSGIIQDSVIDVKEARVLKRWLEEHQSNGEFGFLIDKLDNFLVDGHVDRFESRVIVNALGHTLAQLNRNGF